MKKLLSTLVSSVLALSMIPAMPVYAEDTSDYTCEIKELPYEASVVSSIGGKYFQLRLDVFADTDAKVYYAEGSSVIAGTPRNNRKVAVIDNEGKEIFPYTVTPLNYHYSDGVFSLTDEDTGTLYNTHIDDSEVFWGYRPLLDDKIDDNGDLIILKPRYYNESGELLFDSSKIRSATPMRNGYAIVTNFIESNEEIGIDTPFKYCLINKNGQILIESIPFKWSGHGDGWCFSDVFYEYLHCKEFQTDVASEGLVKFTSAILFEDRLSEEKIIKAPEKDYLGYYQVDYNSDFSTGYFDIEGNIIIPQNNDYDIYGNFGNGLAWVGKYKNGTDNSEGVSVGFINKKGELVIPLKYDEAWQFGSYIDGYALVKSGDTYILIDTGGNKVSSFKLNDVKMYGTNGKIVSGEKDGKCGAVDINNNIILPFEYDDISGIQNDTCMAVKDGKVYSIHFKSVAAPSLGDFTGDGIIDGRDATDVLTLYAKSSVGDIVITAEQLAVADVNKDNILDGRDATIILTYYAKTSTGYAGTLEDFVKTLTK